MSNPYPSMYHWSPAHCRRSINRHGLKPTVPTSSTMSIHLLLQSYSPEMQNVHYDCEAEIVTFKTVCFGFSPSHAWNLSGACSAEPGERWDLWQVFIDDGDLVYPELSVGFRMGEVRVANRIPKSRVWHVGVRVVKSRWETEHNER